jgi:hypothetical protein
MAVVLYTPGNLDDGLVAAVIPLLYLNEIVSEDK